jgi:hypothetical protein
MFPLVLFTGFLGGVLAGTLTQIVTAAESQRPPRVVEAGEFRLVDKDGRIRAVLGMDNRSISCLRLMDTEGHTRVSLSINAFHETAGMYLYDTKDNQMVSLHTYQRGTSSLTFYHDAIPQAELGNELGFRQLGFKPNDPSVTPSLKFWKGGVFNGSLVWHAP